MAPEKFFDSEIVDDEVIETLRGQKVTGYLHWPDSDIEDHLGTLRENIEFLLTESDPDGFLRTQEAQEAWAKERQKAEKNIWDIPFVFPERGHRIYRTLINDLYRAGITSVHELVSRRENLERIRNIGRKGKKYKAIVLMAEHFASRA